MLKKTVHLMSNWMIWQALETKDKNRLWKLTQNLRRAKQPQKSTTYTGRRKHFVHSDICLFVQNVSTAHFDITTLYAWTIGIQHEANKNLWQVLFKLFGLDSGMIFFDVMSRYFLCTLCNWPFAKPFPKQQLSNHNLATVTRHHCSS